MKKNEPPEMSKAEYEKQEKHFASIQVTQTPIESIQTPPFIPVFDVLMKEILEAHEAQITAGEKGGYLITFPAGTYEEEVYPRTQDDRYHIVFPDKFILLETCRRGSTLSYLHLYPDLLTLDQRTRLEEIASRY